MDSVKKLQKEWVANGKYVYGILGDIKSIDVNYLKKLGPVEVLTKEQIFGY